jgi:spore germination protein YaaH
VKHLSAGARSVAAALVVALLAACGSPTTPTTTPGAFSPDVTASAVMPSEADAPSPTAVPAPGHELYGYVPYWEMDSTIAAHLAVTPLTTVGLFSVTNTSKGALDASQTGYRRITGSVGAAMISAAHQRGTRVELVFTSFGAKRNAQFFDRLPVQDATIASLVSLVDALGLDGVNLGLTAAYGAFIGRLRAALTAGHADRTVSIAAGAGPTGAAMATAAVTAGVDRVFLMGYDYRTASSSPGATSPIDRADGGRTLTWSLDLFEGMGVPAEKLLLGLPLYGVAWPVAGPVVGAPATGNGKVFVLRQHLDVLTSPAAIPAMDPVEAVAPPTVGASSPPAADSTTWTAVYVDSVDTLARKLGLAEARGLAGAGFWAIGYERGLADYTSLMTRYVIGAVPPG